MILSFLLPVEHHPWHHVGKLGLRLLFGLSLALNHGWPTLNGALAGASEFPDPLGFGPATTMMLVGGSEFFCALLVAAGLLTRISVLPVLVNFCVAFFIFHAGDPFGEKELAYLYLSAMTCILILGPGNYSLDYLLFHRSDMNRGRPAGTDRDG